MNHDEYWQFIREVAERVRRRPESMRGAIDRPANVIFTPSGDRRQPEKKKLVRRWKTREGRFELRFNVRRRAWGFVEIASGLELPCLKGMTRQQIIEAYEDSFPAAMIASVRL